jgi:hypothetical protein
VFGRRNEVIEKLLREVELTREEIVRNRSSYEEQLQITREVIRRNEIAFQEFRAAFADLREEVRAQTAAILSLLDARGGDESPA